jgi:predicted DNA-binding WGR domain protein
MPPLAPAFAPTLETMPRDASVRLERIDPARNMARYYTLAVELTLFEEVACTRSFGRIGSKGGRIMIGLFGSRADAEAELIALLRAKQKRGYAVRAVSSEAGGACG